MPDELWVRAESKVFGPFTSKQLRQLANEAGDFESGLAEGSDGIVFRNNVQ